MNKTNKNNNNKNGSVNTTKKKQRNKSRRNRTRQNRNTEYSAPVSTAKIQRTTKPMFNRGANTIIKHREYLYDVNQTDGFAVIRIPINPGISSTFPWLSQIAPAYEKYRFKSLRFMYEVLSATTSTGKIFFVPCFNPQDPPPLSKLEALTYEEAVGSQPWVSFVCDIKQKYLKTYNEYFIRQTNLQANQDLKTFDPLVLYLCTDGPSALSTVGEVYIEYEIELINPIGVTEEIGSNQLYDNSLYYYNALGFGENGQNAFGSPSAATILGGLNATISPDLLVFNENYVGFISIQYDVQPLTQEYIPTGNFGIDASTTIQNNNGTSFSWFTYTQETSSSGESLYATATGIFLAPQGSNLNINIFTGITGFTTPVNNMNMVIAPYWNSLIPPVYPMQTLSMYDRVQRRTKTSDVTSGKEPIQIIELDEKGKEEEKVVITKKNVVPKNFKFFKI
jgi:hypothetical protein